MIHGLILIWVVNVYQPGDAWRVNRQQIWLSTIRTPADWHDRLTGSSPAAGKEFCARLDRSRSSPDADPFWFLGLAASVNEAHIPNNMSQYGLENTLWDESRLPACLLALSAVMADFFNNNGIGGSSRSGTCSVSSRLT